MPWDKGRGDAVNSWRRSTGAVLVLAMLLPACATTGPGGKKSVILIGETEERDIGAKMAAQIRAEKKVFTDRVVTDYVSRTGQRIAALSDRPNITYQFTVIEDKSLNAFALPGGYVYIHTGLLRQLDSQSQLAGVLGHEISHIVARHSVKLLQEGLGLQILSSLVFGGAGEGTQAAVGVGLALIMRGYSRGAEEEADSYGTIYMTRAGYNPEGMAQVMDKLAAVTSSGDGFWENLAADHPPAAKRAAAVRAEIKAKGLDAGLPFDPEPYRTIKSRVP
jgi:predicted Zn-dependent protease